MAGGQGTRLRPLTSNQPKPMLPIVGKPMMQHILALARRHGITEVVTTVQFLASVIRNYFGDGSDLGIELSYVTEQEPLGTAGSVKNAEALLDDRFVVLSGDSLTDIDLTQLVEFHEKNGAAVTVTLKRVENPLDFGIVITDEDGRVERFLEKPGWGEVFSDTINTGIYVVEREVLDHVPQGEEFDFSTDLFPLLLDKGLPMFGYVTDRHWTDVGNLEAYLRAHWEVLDRQVEVEIEGFEVSDGVWLGTGAELSPDAHVSGPAFIGENSRIEAGAQIFDHTVLGRSVVVNAGASLQRSVVHDGAYVGGNSSLRGSVLGKNSDVKSGARLEEGVVVADECYVGEGALLNPHVKVYPFKVVDPGAIVSESIVWQSGGARHLFGERGVAGVMNVDVTPELALRLAVAYGGMLPKRSIVATCRDSSRTARIVKRAMIAGANSLRHRLQRPRAGPDPRGALLRPIHSGARGVRRAVLGRGRRLDRDPVLRRAGPRPRRRHRATPGARVLPGRPAPRLPGGHRGAVVPGPRPGVLRPGRLGLRGHRCDPGARPQGGRGLRVRRRLGDGTADPRTAGGRCPGRERRYRRGPRSALPRAHRRPRAAAGPAGPLERGRGGRPDRPRRREALPGGRERAGPLSGAPGAGVRGPRLRVRAGKPDRSSGVHESRGRAPGVRAAAARSCGRAPRRLP